MLLFRNLSLHNIKIYISTISSRILEVEKIAEKHRFASHRSLSCSFHLLAELLGSFFPRLSIAVASDAFSQRHLECVAPVGLVAILPPASLASRLMNPLDLLLQKLVDDGYHADLASILTQKQVVPTMISFLEEDESKNDRSYRHTGSQTYCQKKFREP
jgi:hypothetical protein